TRDAITAIGLSGPHCEKDLRQLSPEIPGAVDEVVQAGPLTMIRVPGIHPRFEIHGPCDALQKAWSRLDVHAAPVGSPAWRLLDILAGIPMVMPETVEEFIPQTLNLDLLGAISFEKGCYTGQEIV